MPDSSGQLQQIHQQLLQVGRACTPRFLLEIFSESTELRQRQAPSLGETLGRAAVTNELLRVQKLQRTQHRDGEWLREERSPENGFNSALLHESVWKRGTGGGGGMKMESVSSHCADSTVYFDRVSGHGQLCHHLLGRGGGTKMMAGPPVSSALLPSE